MSFLTVQACRPSIVAWQPAAYIWHLLAASRRSEHPLDQLSHAVKEPLGQEADLQVFAAAGTAEGAAAAAACTAAAGSAAAAGIAVAAAACTAAAGVAVAAAAAVLLAGHVVPDQGYCWHV